MTNQEQAFLNGFLKRAADYGLNSSQAIYVLKTAETTIDARGRETARNIFNAGGRAIKAVGGAIGDTASAVGRGIDYLGSFVPESKLSDYSTVRKQMEDRYHKEIANPPNPTISSSTPRPAPQPTAPPAGQYSPGFSGFVPPTPANAPVSAGPTPEQLAKMTAMLGNNRPEVNDSRLASLLEPVPGSPGYMGNVAKAAPVQKVQQTVPSMNIPINTTVGPR